MAFAGLWDHWKRPDGPELKSASIIVTTANEDTKAIHDRMPVILQEKDWEKWLDPDNHDTTALHSVLEPSHKGSLSPIPVSARVNSPRNNGPENLEAVS